MRSEKNYQSCPRAKDHACIHHGLYARSPRKTPLLKKKHVEAHLKFVAQDLDKPVKYWENIVWSDESKIWP